MYKLNFKIKKNYFFLIFLFFLTQLNAQSPVLKSINKNVLKVNDTLILNGINIKSIRLVQGLDSFSIVNPISKTMNNLDTNYYFILPSNIMNGYYQLKAINNGLNDTSFNLIRIYNNNFSKSTLFGWGNNGNGELNFPTDTNIIDVAIGAYHSLGLKSDGKIIAWGANNNGETTIQENLNNVVAIYAGYGVSAALQANGNLVVWGDNSWGLLNKPNNINKIKSVSFGNAHILLLKFDGTLICWGNNLNYQLDAPNINNVVAIAAGGYHNVALLKNGNTISWGDSTNMQIYNSYSNIKQIAAGINFSLYLNNNGNLIINGNVDYGEYKYANFIPTLNSSITKILAKGTTIVAYLSNGNIVSWGNERYDKNIIPIELNNESNLQVGYYNNIAVTNVKINVLYDTNKVNVQIPLNYNVGENVTIKIFAKTGYEIQSIFVNNKKTDSTNSFTFNNLKGIQNIQIESNSISKPKITHINKTAVKAGDTVVVTGSKIKSILLKKGNYISIYFPGIISKTINLNNTDTNYSFIMPTNIDDYIYVIKGIGYNNEESNLFLIKNYTHNTDSVGLAILNDTNRIPINLNNVVDFEAGNNQHVVLYNNGRANTWGIFSNRTYQNKKLIDWVNSLENLVSLRIGNGKGTGLTGYDVNLLALKNDGTIEAFGQNNNDIITNTPKNLQNIISIVAASNHFLCLNDKGSVIGWGNNNIGQVTIPFNIKKIIGVFSSDVNQSYLIQEDSTVALLFDTIIYTKKSILTNSNYKIYYNNLAFSYNYLNNNINYYKFNLDNWGLNKIIYADGSYGLSVFVNSDGKLIAKGSFSNYYLLDTIQKKIQLLNNIKQVITTTDYLIALTKNGELIQINSNNNNFTPPNLPNQLNYVFKMSGGNGSNIIMTKLKINTIAGNGGTISNSVFIKRNNKVRITYKANDGFVIDSIIVNGLYIKDSFDGFTFENDNFIPAMQQIKVTFKTNSYFIGINKSIYKQSDTIKITGSNIQKIFFKNLATKDSFVISNFISRQLIGVDTMYAFIAPNAVKFEVYYMNVLTYYNLKLNSFNLVRFVPNNIDSFKVLAWGNNNNGQCNIPSGLSNIAQIAGGSYFSLALKMDGTVIPWGYNYIGEILVPVGLNNVIQISAGANHVLALKADGTVVAWVAERGFNDNGETNIPVDLNNVVQVVGGSSHSIVLKVDGSVVAWGNNNFNQINVPSNLNNVIQIAESFNHNAVLKNDGTVVAWGLDNKGQTDVPFDLNNVIKLQCGNYHTLALKKDGTLVSWGNTNFNLQKKAKLLKNIVNIGGRGDFNLAINANGDIFGWGDTTYNQSIIPVGLSNVTQISSGINHSLVLYKPTSNNTLTFNVATSANYGALVSGEYIGSGNQNFVLPALSTLKLDYYPYSFYKADSININGVSYLDTSTSYIIKNIDKDYTIKAKFKLNCLANIPTPNIYRSEVNNITPYILSIKQNWYLNGVLKDSVFNNPINIYINPNLLYYTPTISGNYTVQAFTIEGCTTKISKPYFYSNYYAIKILPNNDGTIQLKGVNNYKLAKDTIVSVYTGLTYFIKPKQNFAIDSILVNENYYGFSNYLNLIVTENDTIRIVFRPINIIYSKINQFKLNFYLNNYLQNNIYLDSNSNYRISYSIPNGYYIDSFYTNLGEILNKDSVFAYTFTNINANRDIFLILKQKQINVQIIGVNGNQFSININDRTLAKKDSTKLSYFYGNKLNAYLQTDSNFYIDSIWIDNSVLYSYKKQASSNETNPINSYNLNINNLFNNTIVKIKLGQFTPPAPPRLDTVIVANAQAYLYFTLPTNNGGVSILKYEVSSINQNIKLYATQSPVRITGLQNDSNYQFVIKAINKVGTSIASNVSNVIIPKNNVYVVTTNVTNGLISGGASITNNGTYRVTYQANSGFQLDKVYVNDTLRNDSTQGYSFKNFNRNQYIYVVFKPIIYKLLAQSNNGGMFILNRESKQQINISTNAGSNNAIIIQANYGYKIDSIFVNNVLKPFTNKQLTQINILNILGDSTIRVVFKKASYVVKINYGKGGQVYPSNQINVLENDSINIRLFPNYGYEVDSIFINNQYINTSVKTNYWFKNVQGDSTIRVVFKNVLYSITSSVKNTNGGIISPAGKQFAQKGENKTYYIIPYYGYKIDTIWVNEIAVIINPNATSYFAYTFKNIQGDSSIKVSYKKNRSTIVSAVNRINNIRYGRITPSGKVTLINGQGYKYKIIPNSNGKLDSILIDNKKVLLTLNADSSGYDTATQIYTFKNIQSDKSINVFFSSKPAVNNYKINANEYTIISSSNLENALNVEGENIFSAGDNFTYTFEYDTLYYLDSLIIDGVVTNNYLNINNSISYAFNNINANHSIRAVFKKNIFTIISEQDGNGNINYVGTNYVKLGAQIKYSYQAESNYFVDSVIVNGVLIDSPQSFTFTNVQQDNTIKIIYNQSQYTIQSIVTEGGNINPLGTLLLNKGETYTYQYSANAGYSIDSVIIDGIVNYDSLSSYTFTNVQTNHRIQIVYKKNYYTITSSKNIEGGLISNEGINIVVNGSTQLYFIQANAGYKIDSIYINNIGQSINQQTYIYEINNINKDINIYVIFKNIYYTITASAEVGGGISPIGNIQVKYDSSQAFSISPNTGYVIDSVIVNGVYVGKINSYTFNNVKGDSNIRVTFKLKTFSITATAGTGGSISPQATTTLNYGSSQRYIITANAGYIIDSVIINGFKVDSTTSYTFNNITANQTIQAVFKIAVVCPQTKLSPNIVRVGDALKSDITTFAKQRWYLAGTIKDSTTNNTYTPTDAGVYTLLGIDALGCESNLSKKYYYAKTCITPTGRLGNGANIQANIVGNANLIIIKWCTDLIKENITIQVLDISGAQVYEQEVPYNLGTMILNKSKITSKNYYIQVLDSKGEIMQISDLIKN